MKTDRLCRALGTTLDVAEWRHATAILESDFPHEWQDMVNVLSALEFSQREGVQRKASSIKEWDRLRDEFYGKGWRKWQFYTRLVVDTSRLESPTHEVTCLKGRVAMEVEWNSVGHRYDRHLNNFRALFDLRAISVGVVVTRSDDPQNQSRGSHGTGMEDNPSARFGKLVRLMNGASSGGCPVLAIGIKAPTFVEAPRVLQAKGVVKGARH